ncbi:MAG TPA: FtsX-like permease family protein, partial [Iamia sp.]|nr:FtsX-like permease family protein [Iamia sp.]
VLTDTIGKTFDGLLAELNEGTDVHVRSDVTTTSDQMGEQRARLDASLVDTIKGVDGVQAAEGSIEGYAQMVDHDGEPMGNPEMGAPTVGTNWFVDPELNPTEVVEGRAPTSPGEVVIDKRSAELGDFAVGEDLTVITPTGTLSQTVVGIVTFAGEDSPGGASLVMFSPDAAQAVLTEPGRVDAIKVVAQDGVDQATLADRIDEVVPGHTEVLTGAEVTAEDQQDIKDGMAFFNTFLLVFALIALFVGSFIIYNSFSIIVAQRGKEMALMRAIGASRRQVLASVIFESFAVGALASVAGLVAGIGVAGALKALLGQLGIDVPAGDVVITTNTVIVSMIAGFGVSVASAVFPARRASKVAPIAAMRDVAHDDSASSRARKVIGGGFALLGTVALALGVAGPALALVGLGALLIFIGTVVLGPVLARPVSWLLGSPLPRLRGVAGSLARQNAMRNPKRTAATASALMIGVTLVVFISILGASTKASVESTVDETFAGDLVVDSMATQVGGLVPTLAADLDAQPEIDAVAAFRRTAAEVDGTGRDVVGIDPAALQQIIDVKVTDGSLDDLGATQIAVDADTALGHGWKVGDSLPVAFTETGEQQLTVAALYEESVLVGQFLIGLPAYEANVADQLDAQVFLTFADGVSAADGRALVDGMVEAYPQAEVQDHDEYAAAQTKQMDVILSLIYALLGLAVLIALLGIANTLALSIFERTRELGLLRAVGMTRPQLRATVRWEAVIIALLGTSLGMGLGVVFGWSMVKGLGDEGLGTFELPIPTLVIVSVIAALAGTAAALLPARRAARLDVLGAIVGE